MPLWSEHTRVETERLVLRPRAAEDADVVRRLWAERDPWVPAHRRFDAEGRPTVADLAARIARERDDPTAGLMTVQRREAGDVIGYCGLLLPGEGGSDEPELAFELLREVHGRGYATEAASAVVELATAAGHHRLRATVRDWNVASRWVLEKLGFRETGDVEVDAVHGDSLLTVRSAPTSSS
ncbi:GNAT family N-acetyltransferase [Nocardioides alkalitolerans]|uniref:GNAT family N-acetyltransferase n=1 Tax=Nocardioides alkalitolerans TaxID=281714 RepID=UPI000426FB68|nr:GNAT family N-acetyltransferase [Nocardioides alkalitolerans]